MPDRLLVDLDGDGQVVVSSWPEGRVPEEVFQGRLEWPLGPKAIEDLRWYLEDYLLAPFGVWEDRGPAVKESLAGWGEQVYASLFGAEQARRAYERMRNQGLELMIRSDVPALLGLPWELMRDHAGPVALGAGGITRSLPSSGLARLVEVPDGRLRVLMVISRPAGVDDVEYQMVARPLLQRLKAVHGEVQMTVLRPPTFDALSQVIRRSADAGEPFHVVHFDGHGIFVGRNSPGGEGMLVFELPEGGPHYVSAQAVARVLSDAKVPLVVLNACQSGAVGKELEASVATALMRADCSAVVAMGYSVNAVAASEFMASFYDALFEGASVGEAVTAGRRRLFEHDGRPSLKGDMPLADWLVPVHYMRRDVLFPKSRVARPTEVPPDQALGQARATLPGASTAADELAPTLDAVGGVFVGRDDLFYQLEVAAQSQQLVILTAPGGTGKTELAKGFARWWRDTGGIDDPQLVFWHSFEPGVATFGLDGVISEVGLKIVGADFVRGNPGQQLEAVKQLLCQYRALLVWDNFESVAEMPDFSGATPTLDDEDRRQLREFLLWVRDHSKSAVVITSRAREDWLGEIRRVPVPGLSRAEAAQYAQILLDPFPEAQRRQQHRSFGELLHWLDGHPLAMRLTLPLLQETDPKELLDRLRGIDPLPGGDDGGVRLTSLSACVTYSLAHLGESDQRLLLALSLFDGIADENLLMLFSSMKEAPSRFAGATREEWAAVLQGAARVGLLSEISGGMFRIHPALPGYLAGAWLRADPDGYRQEREAAERALCAACADFSGWLTGQIGTGSAGPAHRIIGLQRQTLSAMLGHALDHHAWDDAGNILTALQAYWHARGLVAETDAWVDRIVAATTKSGQQPVEGSESLWLYSLGILASLRSEEGEFEKSAQANQQMIAWLEKGEVNESKRRGIAAAYHQSGIIAKYRGRLDEAESWYRKSLTFIEELGNHPAMASTFHQLGTIAQDRGRLDEADDFYRKSLTIEEELGDRSGMASTFHQLGRVAQDRGRLDEADDFYRKSFAIKEELGDRLGVASTYHELGVKALERRRPDEAEDWLRKSLTIKEELGDRLGVAITYHELGVTAQIRGRLDEAEDWLRKSLAIEEQLGNQPVVASNFHQLGMIAQACGRLDEAEDWYRKSLALKEELQNWPGMALTSGALGVLAEDRGQFPQALDWTIRCLILLNRISSPLIEAGLSQLAHLYHQLDMPIVQEAWERLTGQPLPSTVRNYIVSHRNST